MMRRRLLEEGSRVRHVMYQHLTGRIVRVDASQPWPYTVRWTCPQEAEKVLGMYCSYPRPEDLEPIRES